MKRSIVIHSMIFGIIVLLLIAVMGCDGSDRAIEEKVTAAEAESTYRNIYDILEDYPSLESFFTNSEMTIAEFENKLFGEFLGDTSTANVLGTLTDILPSLIDEGIDIPSEFIPYSAQVQSKRPVPDLIATMGALTSNIIAIENTSKEPVYHFLEKLDQLETEHPDLPDTTDYIVTILRKVTRYLSSLDPDDINLVMDFMITDLQDYVLSREGELDVEDVDELVEKFARVSPDGLSQFLQGMKKVLCDKEMISTLKGFFHATGNFLGDDAVYTAVRDLLINIHGRYDGDQLGRIIDHLWEKGPFIGPVVAEIGFDRFGKDGRQEYALRDLLMHADLFDALLVAIHNFEKQGYAMDRVDEQFIKMVKNDPFGFDRSGPGEFGGGRFYAPNDMVSYKNFSALKALTAYLTRWNVPLTFTANFLFEAEGAENSADKIRKLIPTADELTITHSLWTEIYEKGEGYYMGHGRPVTEKRGYGKMVDGVYVAPICPAVVGAADMALFLVADGLYNGPYDNIYDNMRWVVFERKYYATMDLVQLAPRIPMVQNILPQFFDNRGIESLPITFMVNEGATSTVYVDLDTIVKNIPEAVSNAAITYDLPDWVTDLVAKVIETYIPCGYKDDDSGQIYFMPRDVRDMWVLVQSLAFYDTDAFHPDRFLDTAHPENYRYFYDIRAYSYKNNPDKANPLFNLVAALGMACYLSYQEVVSPYPLTLDAVDDRLNAAKEAFGVTYPFNYVLNLLSPLAETTTEVDIYRLPAEESMPLIQYLEPLVELKSNGVIDSLLKVLSVMGKPGLAGARNQISTGFAQMVETIERDSTSPYTLANELLTVPQKAVDDKRRWASMKLSMDVYSGMFSVDSNYAITDDVVGLVNHVTDVDIPDEAWARASRGIVEMLGSSTRDRILTRSMIHTSTILKAVNTAHIWADTFKAVERALRPDGVMSYVLCGIERDPRFSYAEILSDTDGFFHSETMMSDEEGSFWRDIYYFVDFMANALEFEDDK